LQEIEQLPGRTATNITLKARIQLLAGVVGNLKRRDIRLKRRLAQLLRTRARTEQGRALRLAAITKMREAIVANGRRLAASQSELRSLRRKRA
jgi:hypothetical protein